MLDKRTQKKQYDYYRNMLTKKFIGLPIKTLHVFGILRSRP